MSKSQRHHYLPQFYLKNFTDVKGLLWVFDRDAKEYRQQTPKNIAVQRDYYAVKDEQGEKNFKIEEYFLTPLSNFSIFLSTMLTT